MEMQIIKLLNEFEKEKTKQDVRFWDYYQNGFHYLENGQTYSELLMISKKYEFIKRLIEKDKIDIKKLIVKGEMRSGWDFENKKGDEETGEESWNKYFSELCLMLLSIQDKPTNFLISILK